MADVAVLCGADRVRQKLDSLLPSVTEYVGHELPEVRIRTDLRGNVAGQARIQKCYLTDTVSYELRINAEALLRYPDDTLNETVPHELAHIVAYEVHGKVHAHGPEWQRIARHLGASGDRCHSLKLTPARQTKRYIGTCSCREHKLSAVKRNRILLGTQYYVCRRCRERITL